jgi:diguanylate cyclase (GGDEF)-like protein/PAS domain S-box-containing protein
MAARATTQPRSIGHEHGDQTAPFQRIVESIPAVTYARRAGAEGSFLYVSPQIETLLGLAPAVFVTQADRWLHCVHPFDRDRFVAALRDATATDHPFHAEYRMLTRGGRILWVRDTAAVAAHPADGTPVWNGVVVDITADKDAELQLHRLAFYDPLTGLPNRRLCMDQLQAMLAQPGRKNVALLFLDLDRFKVINDGIGHAAGDELLIAVARRLAPHVARHGSLARFGGDEFVAVLDRVGDAADVEVIAETLLAALRHPFLINGYDLIVGGTIGVAISGPDTNTPQDLLRAADVALYRAKAHGGDAVAVFDPHRDQGGLERLEREAELRRALEQGEFEIAYQPVVDIDSGRILAVEALLRWRHPERGVLPPAAFIPLADETGLIIPLGQWVIEEACRQVRDWQERFPAARALQVSVNLSGRQFRQSALHADVARALGRSGLQPQSLALELKEADALANAVEVAATLKAFKELGVKVTIDNFGRGWSALSSLTQFTIDDLKIDGSCVSRLGGHQGGAAIVRALVSMAKAVGLDVTAGAVETGEQLSLLRELGCDRAQGHHFAPPLTVEELERILQRDSEAAVPATAARAGAHSGKDN